MHQTNTDPLIVIEDLCKSYKILKKNPGVGGAIKALFSAQYNIVEAVKGISFQINKGELVGYVGPNGAGKSTTIKMMSGILYPTSGSIKVGGLQPFRNKKKYSMNLGVMFGQRTQLWWDLPVSESFDLLKTIYKVDKKIYNHNLEFFSDILGIREFWGQPVRRLSLGQRVRADLAAALIHDPEVLFLDEPTIGLDVLAKEKFRELIKKVNKEKKTTILITSHDLGDIENVANRLLLIDHGSVVYDGDLKRFVRSHSYHSRLVITFYKRTALKTLPRGVELIEKRGDMCEFELDHRIVSYQDLLAKISKWGEIKDMHMQSASLEKVLMQMYRDSSVK